MKIKEPKGKYFIFVRSEVEFQVRHTAKRTKVLHSFKTMTEARQKRDELNAKV